MTFKIFVYKDNQLVPSHECTDYYEAVQHALEGGHLSCVTDEKCEVLYGINWGGKYEANEEVTAPV